MILTVGGLSFQYKSREIFNDVTFDLGRNEVLAIMGPNGVGKTTLLRCLNLILKPTGGTIMVEEQNIMHLAKRDVAKRLGYVPQKQESGRMTAFDAILLGRRPHITWDISEKDLKIVHGVIKRLNLEHLSLQYIDQMSGGELQKVSIARALVQEPDLLLLDEPTSSLDLKNQLEILSEIRNITRFHSVSVIMTMHDLNLALRFLDKFIFLKSGMIYSAGTCKDVTPEMIHDVYGVQTAINEMYGYPVVIPLTG
ncbi:ABC transporter related protein [Methanospirillum hungatei JF-1]|uniref:Cobalamin import ATP-binding protein BtuD n=1 Tax=Methanospirillum hungatei JF-1 (strain ATCC 27890 / DSM 864 / NBRC 100397 / JF-1) TaxID=323259 RepID=Q2FMJ4_METHJ|nr:ABC transporter ATP-binding protein [Methanospirillum hungatei]ABD39993.1 ABC transporter related protein [Methanospirillum hungatei JF-1]